MIALQMAPHRIDRIFAHNESALTDSSHSYSAHMLPQGFRSHPLPREASCDHPFELSAQNLEYQLAPILDAYGSKRLLVYQPVDLVPYFKYEPGENTRVFFKVFQGFWVRQTPPPTVWLEHGYDLEPRTIYRSHYAISEKLTTSQMVYKPGRLVFSCHRVSVALGLPSKPRRDRPLRFVWYNLWRFHATHRLRDLYTPLRSPGFLISRYLSHYEPIWPAPPDDPDPQCPLRPIDWQNDPSEEAVSPLQIVSDDLVESADGFLWNAIDLSDAEATDLFFARINAEPLLITTRQPHYEPRTISAPATRVDRPGAPPSIRTPFLAGLMLWVRSEEQIRKRDTRNNGEPVAWHQLGLVPILEQLRSSPCRYFALGCFVPSHMGQVTGWDTRNDHSVMSQYDAIWLAINPLWRRDRNGRETTDRCDLGRDPRPVL